MNLYNVCYGFIQLFMNTFNGFLEIGFANLVKKERV